MDQAFALKTENRSPVLWRASQTVLDKAPAAPEPTPENFDLSQLSIRELESKLPGTIVRFPDQKYGLIPAKRGTRVSNRGKDNETMTLTLLMGSGKNETMDMATFLQSAEAILLRIMTAPEGGSAAKGANAGELMVNEAPARIEFAGDESWGGDEQRLTRIMLCVAGPTGTAVDIEAAVASLSTADGPLTWQKLQTAASAAAAIEAASASAAAKKHMRELPISVRALAGTGWEKHSLTARWLQVGIVGEDDEGNYILPTAGQLGDVITAFRGGGGEGDSDAFAEALGQAASREEAALAALEAAADTPLSAEGESRAAATQLLNALRGMVDELGDAGAKCVDSKVAELAEGVGMLREQRGSLQGWQAANYMHGVRGGDGVIADGLGTSRGEPITLEAELTAARASGIDKRTTHAKAADEPRPAAQSTYAQRASAALRSPGGAQLGVGSPARTTAAAFSPRSLRVHELQSEINRLAAQPARGPATPDSSSNTERAAPGAPERGLASPMFAELVPVGGEQHSAGDVMRHLEAAGGGKAGSVAILLEKHGGAATGGLFREEQKLRTTPCGGQEYPSGAGTC